MGTSQHGTLGFVGLRVLKLVTVVLATSWWVVAGQSAETKARLGSASQSAARASPDGDTIYSRFSQPSDALFPTQGDIDQLGLRISGNVTSASSDDFVVPLPWNERAPPTPALIVSPRTVEDVQEALAFTRKHNLRLAVWSTGHSLDHRNTADNSLLLDMSRYFDSVSVNVENRTVVVGTGADFTKINTRVKEESDRSLVALSGGCPSVGPFGWSTVGGYGRLTRMYGLGSDALIAADIITANGTALRLENGKEEHAELFRALKGGGGPVFGVATSLTFKLFDDPGPVLNYVGYHEITEENAKAAEDFLITASNNSGMYFILDKSPRRNLVQIAAYCMGDLEGCRPRLEELESKLGYCSRYLCKIAEYDDFHGLLEYEELIWASPLVRDLTSAADTGPNYYIGAALDATGLADGGLQLISNFTASYRRRDFPGTDALTCSANANSGGISATLDPDRTLTSVPPAARNHIVQVACNMRFTGPLIQEHIDYMDNFAEEVLRPRSVQEWVYWNEGAHNFPDWKKRYWGGTEEYDRLLAVKLQYDPENRLTCFHCIGSDLIDFADNIVCPSGCASCTNLPKSSDGQCAPQPILKK